MTAQWPEGTTGKLIEEAVTRSVIGSFYEVYRLLGFGFRELIYSLALQRDLVAKGHRVDRDDFGKNPRFYRVIFENRFKRRTRANE